MFATLILSSLLSYTFALPSGSPICRKNGEFTSHHGKSPDPYAPFKATAEVVKDLEASVKVTGPFKGLLLYVSESMGQTNVGSFNKPTGFEYVSGCGGPETTLTHMSDNTKSDTVFTWTAPKAGSYVVTAIVTGGKTPWNEFSIKIDVGNQSAPTTSQTDVKAEAQPTETDTLTGDSTAPKIKCRQKFIGY